MRSRWGRPRVQDRRDDALANLDPHEFERVVADYYRAQGYRVEHCARPGHFDGGIDLKLFRGSEYVIVQCKRENALQVTHNVVHELLGVMLTEGADRAIVVNAGEFTRYARESAAKNPRIELIDGSALRAMLGPGGLANGRLTSSSQAARIAAHVGDRLMAAAEDRIRHGGRRRTWKTDVAIGVVAAKVLVPTIGLLMLLAWFNAQVEKASAVQQQQARAREAAPPALPVPPSRASATPIVQSGNPCYEMIDARSGTYIDHCAKVAPRSPPTAAEIREAQRQADEAMRVLAPTTPEVPLTLPHGESTWPRAPADVAQ
jgi:hypothetical protein